MSDTELMDELHAKLESRNTRATLVVLWLSFLALLALWCWSQQATS